MLCGACMRRGSLVCFVVRTHSRRAQYALWCMHATGELSVLRCAYMRRVSLVCFVVHACDRGA